MDTQEDIEAVQSKAEEGFGRLRERVNRATKDFSQNARQNATETWEKTAELIRDNPGTSVGIALLVGAGIGALIAAMARD